jgi:hypothetical protein
MVYVNGSSLAACMSREYQKGDRIRTSGHGTIQGAAGRREGASLQQ